MASGSEDQAPEAVPKRPVAHVGRNGVSGRTLVRETHLIPDPISLLVIGSDLFKKFPEVVLRAPVTR